MCAHDERRALSWQRDCGQAWGPGAEVKGKPPYGTILEKKPVFGEHSVENVRGGQRLA